MAMTRPDAARAPRLVGVPAAVDDLVKVGFPATVEWLTEVVWDDGTKRQTGTIMVLAEDGVWKAWLHDRALQRASWLSAESLDGLLLRIEEQLATGKGEWRLDKKGK